MGTLEKDVTYPADTGRKLNVRRRPGCLLTSSERSIYILCLRGMFQVNNKSPERRH